MSPANRPLATLILLAAVLGAQGPVWSAERPIRRPNVLFLLSDDQRADTIRALGNPIIDTPNLDRLVREGTVFTRAVSPNPLCITSRVELLSGCCGIRRGRVEFGKFAPDHVLWPEVMRQAGYHTWHVGKWHVPGRPNARGFEECLGLFAGGGPKVEAVDFCGRKVTGYVGWVFQTDDGRRFPEQGVGLVPNISAVFADAAIAFLERKPDEPFFLQVNFTAPHDPLLIPPGYEGKYDPAQIPLPPNFLAEHPFDHGNLHGRDEQLFATPRTPEEVGRELAAYYAVISHMDAQIGRILDVLDSTGQAENTLVVFSSDQGLAIGSHGLRGKQNMYEHTVNVPLILRGPGIPQGSRRSASCYLRDLYPTVCEMAGIEVPEVVQGRSLVPVLRGQREALYGEIYGYFRDVQRMVRTDRWKLIFYPKLGRCQLFDLREDPDERNDLFQDPRHAAIGKELCIRLAAWQREVGDPAPRPTGRLGPATDK